MTATATWTGYETVEVVAWAAEFEWSVPAAMLLDWQQELFAAGERHGILRVDEAPFMGYVRERDGPVGAFVRAHPDRVPRYNTRIPAGFLPAALGSRPGEEAVTRTLLEYLDADGVLRSAWIGELTEAYPAIPLPNYFPYPAVEVTASGGLIGQPAVDRMWVIIGTSVDIWFPWNRPMFRYPLREPMDNRVLSRRNGGRLNAFLAHVRAATLATGGIWRMDTPKPTGLHRADEFGIDLDGPLEP